jgi:hypothetical protein
MHTEARAGTVENGTYPPRVTVNASAGGLAMSHPEQLRQNRAYRLGLSSLAVVAAAVIVTIIGIVITALTGNETLLVVGLVTLGGGVIAGWTALSMLLRWARGQQRSRSVTTLDALMEVRRRLDLDVRRLLGRADPGR